MYIHVNFQKRAKATKPVYTGGVPNNNRFNVLPGYRWDGVDRGTGYEVGLTAFFRVLILLFR